MPGAATARELADDPQRFLPTVQVGITLVEHADRRVRRRPDRGRPEGVARRYPGAGAVAETLSLALVVVVTTYLTLVLGELVPKHLALRRPEQVAAGWRPRSPGWRGSAVLSSGCSDKSSALMLRLFGLHRAARQTVTEEELKALLAEGAQAGVLETEERDMIERLLRLADKPVRAIMTPRTEIAWIDRTDTPKEIAAALKSAPHSRFVVCEGAVDNVVGVVQAKDILDRILEGGDVSLGRGVAPADRGARHGDRAGCAGAAQVRSARDWRW